MYIAFKWLVSLAFIMWLVMCITNPFLKENMNISNTDVLGSPCNSNNYINESVKIQLLPDVIEVDTKEMLNPYNAAGLHILMFLAGALAVAAFQKKQEIVTYTHCKIPTLNMLIFQLLYHLKIAASRSGVAIVQYSRYIQEKIKIILKIHNKIKVLKKTPIVKNNNIHEILLKKLKEMTEERKSLGQLLISAIRENKYIRMRYELETMTKNRLKQHMEDTQKQIKENRSRYVSFQQLYLLTHQENIYLKARLVKLKQEKEESEKDLMCLINQVYMSKNKDLKTYCTRFLVKTKDNLLNTDVDAEIKQILKNSRKPTEINLISKNSVNSVKIPSCTSIQITEIVNEEDSLVPLAPDEPKLRGLPGEYVWTVKDKNGMIEKLYEYDYKSDLDGGDTIRRIRQYSVYFDKDCLLDFSRKEHGANTSLHSSPTNSKMLDYSLSNQKIVTGSEAFQNFLKSSTSIVHIKPTAQPLP